MLGAAGYLSWIGEPESHGRGARLAAGADIELSQDRRDVMVDRFLGDDEPLGDLRVTQPVGEQHEHLELAPGQTGRVFARARARPSW